MCSYQVAIEDCNTEAICFILFFLFSCCFFWFVYYFFCLCVFVCFFFVFSFNSKLQPAEKQKKFLLQKRPPARPRIPYLSPLFSPHPSIAILTSCFGGIMSLQVGGANPRVTSLAPSSPSYLLACV